MRVGNTTAIDGKIRSHDGGRCRHAPHVTRAGTETLKLISCKTMMYQNGTNRVDARASNSAGLGRMMASEAPL